MKKKLLASFLAFCMILSLIPGTAFATGGNLPFTDVDTTDWFYDAVQYAYEKGMMSGTSTTAFSPGGTTSRGMIVTVLHRMEGTPATSGAVFTNVPDGQWYTNAVAWASANNIVGGYGNGLFGPDDVITREQMASILYRYSQYKNYTVDASGSIARFADAAKTSSYAVDAMNWAIGGGLISGVNGNLEPNGGATRAQVATILKRYCENVVPAATSASAPAPEANEVTYTVTFDLNYGSNTQYEKVSVKAGETVSKPFNPSRSGYSFSGWYMEKSGGSQFDFKKSIASDLTLYAHWSKISGGGSGWNRPVEDDPETPPVDADRATGEELVRAAKIASQNLHSIEEPFRDGDGHVNMDDWPELLEKLDAWGRRAKAEGKLLDYASSEDGYSVTIQDPTGLVMCYVPPIKAPEGYAGKVQTYEPYYGVDEDFEKAKKKYGSIDQVAEKIKTLGYDFSTNADGKDINFDTLKQWKPNGMIFWQGHGVRVLNDFGDAYFGGLMTTMKLEEHCEEYASYNAKTAVQNTLVGTDVHGNIYVTPNFFDHFYQDGTSLKGSMIWLGCCYSAYKEGFASVFQKKGASLTIGSPGKVDISYVVHLLDKFANILTSKDGTEYSAKEALEQAKKQVNLPKGSADMIAQRGDFRLSTAEEPTTISLSGVIQDDVSKEAIKGAVVAINGVNHATTDVFGKFTVEIPEANDALPVRVVCTGYEDYEAIVSKQKVQKGWTITLTPAGKGTVTLPIRLEPDRGKITSGTVAVYELTDVKRNEDGSIQGIDGTGDFISSKELIKNVRFWKDTLAISGLESYKVYSLEIAAEGYNTEKILYDCPGLVGEKPLTMVVKVTAVPPAKRFFILSVTDLQTGKPISEAAVTLSGRSNDTEAYQKLTSGSTDAKGMFLADVEGKYTDLRADVVKDGYITGAVETTETTASLSLSKESGQGVDIPEGYTPIYTAKDLEAMNGEGQGILMNDIQITNRFSISVWSGVLDGDGHSIIFRAWSGVDVPYWIEKNTGVLRNITFENLFLYSTGGHTNSANCALVGTNSGTIENCEIASGRILSNADQAKAAGFASNNDTSGVIRNCINRAEIKSTAGGSSSLGAGACGIAYTNQGIIEGCTNCGSVYAEVNNIVAWGSLGTLVAGITGSNHGTVTNCSNQGELSGKNSVRDSYVKIYEICPED